MSAINYFHELNLPESCISPKLQALLTPVGLDPLERPEVTARYEYDQYGPDYEYVHMVMALTDEADALLVADFGEVSDGVVSFSTPIVDNCGGLAGHSPSVSSHEYVVASHGNGSFYSYHLAEKLWMTLGLSPRCIGGDDQRLIYDDLSLPEFGVAEGEIASSYYYKANRNVSWRISNEYLRKYLWLKGKHGTRVFFYEAYIQETQEISDLLGDNGHYVAEPEDGWYELDIRRIDQRILMQISAVVCAVSPELCAEQTAAGLSWPGITGAVDHQRANALVEPTPIFLDDRFLERYEQNSFYETTPFQAQGSWTCNPSYSGQWSFTDCRRVGRNLIQVRLRELYKPKPDREIVWAHAHVVPQEIVDQSDLSEEHIVAKAQRFLEALLGLADGLAWLATDLGLGTPTCEDLIGFSREELRAEHWLPYPNLNRLAQVAPLSMSEQKFLSRCKEIHELWQKIPNGILRRIADEGGHDPKSYKSFGSLKLLQILTNILERLNSNYETTANFSGGHQESEIADRNANLAPLFLTADLRNADAHTGGSVSKTLTQMGFDMLQTNSGYGTALDFVFDQNIAAFTYIGAEIEALRIRSP